MADFPSCLTWVQVWAVEQALVAVEDCSLGEVDCLSVELSSE